MIKKVLILHMYSPFAHLGRRACVSVAVRLLAYIICGRGGLALRRGPLNSLFLFLFYFFLFLFLCLMHIWGEELVFTSAAKALSLHAFFFAVFFFS